MTVVTISRELGSVGTQIAEAVAAALKAICVDKAVLAEMAREAGLAVEEIVHAEERLKARSHLVSAEMKTLLAKTQSLGAVDQTRYNQQMAEVLRLLAERSNVVFIGRGAQFALREHPDALHVHLYAPVEVRAQRIQVRRSLSDLATATQLIQQADEQRRQWYRQLFQGADWKKPQYYHLLLDTHRIPVDLAVAIIVQAAQAGVAQPAK